MLLCKLWAANLVWVAKRHWSGLLLGSRSELSLKMKWRAGVPLGSMCEYDLGDLGQTETLHDTIPPIHQNTSKYINIHQNTSKYIKEWDGSLLNKAKFSLGVVHDRFGMTPGRCASGGNGACTAQLSILAVESTGALSGAAMGLCKSSVEVSRESLEPAWKQMEVMETHLEFG